MSALARAEREGSADAPGALGEVDADVGRMRHDEVSGGIESDAAIDVRSARTRGSTKA